MRAIIAMFLLLALASCSDGNKKPDPNKVKTVSAPYEMLLVVNKEWLSQPAGEEFLRLMEAPIEGLPNPEPNFKLTKVNPADFNGTFQYYAHVVTAEISPKYKKAEVRMSENPYAHPQLVFSFTAPDEQSLLDCAVRHYKNILRAFTARELDRERHLLEKTYNHKVAAQIKKQFGIDIRVPKEIESMKTGKDFLWASTEANPFRMNICIYTLPLHTTDLYSFVTKRDSLMQINIPGGREDQWMQTAAPTVFADSAKVGGKTINVVRGLWDMRNDAMGGPMVAYLFPDETQGRLIVAEGFMFAPEVKKRPYYRKLEAALQTTLF